jgi:general secretion pathway protein J
VRRDGVREDGFTLVELLVALFITAILFAMGYGAVNQAMANKGAIEEQNRRLLEVQTTMRLMAQDFEQAVPRPVREPLGGENWLPAFESQAAAQGTDRQAALVSLTRTGWANPAGIQRATLQRVSYVLDEKTLHRDHSLVLDAAQTNELVRRDLLTNVKSVTLRFMDGSRKWIDQWPSPSIVSPDPRLGAYPQPGSRERARPLAVEVTLELDDWGKIMRIFEITQ